MNMNRSDKEFDADSQRAGSADESAETESAFVAEVRPKVSRSAFTFFGILLSGAGAVLFMTLRSGPQSAGAAMIDNSATANTAIADFLMNGSSNIDAMKRMLRNTEAVVKQFTSYPSATQIPLGDLKTNPFKQSAARQAPADADIMRKRRDAERGAALKAVQALQLQSILFSDTRKSCMINNAMLREGQQVDAFTIEKIAPGSVVVRSGMYRFELKMQR